MSRRLELDDFGHPSAAPAAAAVLSEDARLAAYEDGYKAGWDDAVAAEEESQARIATDFARNLRDLGFTYAEARAHVLDGITPLLCLMAEKILPETARDCFAENILDLVRAEAGKSADQPIQIVINPSQRAALDSLLEQAAPAFPLVVTEEDSLGPGQAHIRSGAGETTLDIDEAEARIREAVAAALTPKQEAKDHG